MLSQTQIAKLVGERWSHPAVYPDGKDLVDLVYGPVHALRLRCANSELPDPQEPAGDLAGTTSSLKKAFSVWRCLTDPDSACDCASVEGYAHLMVHVGSCNVSAGSRTHDLLERESGVASSVETKIQATSELEAKCENCSTLLSEECSDSPCVPAPSGPSNSLLPFLVVSLGKQVVYRTRAISVPGSWNEQIKVALYKTDASISFELFDKDFNAVSSPDESQRISGISIDLGNCKYNTLYVTSMNVSICLPPAIPLLTVLEWISADQKRDQHPQFLSLQKDSLSSSYQSVNVRVDVSIELIPSCGKGRRAHFGGLCLALYGHSPQRKTALSVLDVRRDSLDIANLLYKLKLLNIYLFEIVLNPLYRTGMRFCHWDNPLLTGGILLVLWIVLLVKPVYLPSLIFYSVVLICSKIVTEMRKVSRKITPSYLASIRDSLVIGTECASLSESSIMNSYIQPLITSEVLVKLKKVESILDSLVLFFENLMAQVNQIFFQRNRNSYCHVALLYPACLIPVVFPTLTKAFLLTVLKIALLAGFASTLPPVATLRRLVVTSAYFWRNTSSARPRASKM